MSFLLEILIWSGNVMGVYCFARLAQLSTTVCFSKVTFLWNPHVRDGLRISKMSFHLENINLIGKCYKDLLLYSPSTTRHNFLFFKIPIFVKSGVVDGLCISKMSFHLENVNLIGKCDVGLLLYSPSTTQHNFLFLKIPIFVKSPCPWWTTYFENEFSFGKY